VTHFELAWLSTDAQIATVTDAYRHASLPAKLLGTFDIPNDAAHARGVFTPWMRIPLIFVAQGGLTVDERAVVFTPRIQRLFGWRMHGVRSHLSFEYPGSELDAVEPADIQSPVAHFFNIPFTRIRTRHAPPLDNFLLCVGGRFAMPRIRKRSLELRQELLNFIDRPTV
jgi:hypothetical protein